MSIRLRTLTEGDLDFANIGSDGLTLDERGNLYATWQREVWTLTLPKVKTSPS